MHQLLARHGHERTRTYFSHPPQRWPCGSSCFPSSRYSLREPESGQEDPAPNFGGIWKTALQTWLPQCLALFWPAIHQRIDWAVAPVFLDKELRQIERFLKQGEKRVDLLAQVALKSGQKALLLLHLEVQAGHMGPHFPERMFHYRIRLYERHPNHALLSCAILLDGGLALTYGRIGSAGLEQSVCGGGAGATDLPGHRAGWRAN